MQADQLAKEANRHGRLARNTAVAASVRYQPAVFFSGSWSGKNGPVMDKVCALHFTRTERVKSIIADGHLKPSNPHNTEAAVWAASSENTELSGSVLAALRSGQKHMNGVAKERHKNDGCTELDDVTFLSLTHAIGSNMVQVMAMSSMIGFLWPQPMPSTFRISKVRTWLTTLVKLFRSTKHTSSKQLYN